MEKTLFNTKKDFTNWKKENNHAEIDFSNEDKPLKYPCIAIISYSEDVEFGEYFQCIFVYPYDFKKIENENT